MSSHRRMMSAWLAVVLLTGCGEERTIVEPLRVPGGAARDIYSQCPEIATLISPLYTVYATSFSYTVRNHSSCNYYQLDVRDSASGTLLADTSLVQQGYAIGQTDNEIPSSWVHSTLTRGRYYRWRARAAYSGLNFSAWSSFATFAMITGTPSVLTHTISTRYPQLTWSAGDGASSYRIYRIVSGHPWDLWSTVSTTSYKDVPTRVLSYLGNSSGSSSNFVGFRIVGVSDQGIESSYDNEYYYEVDGIAPY